MARTLPLALVALVLLLPTSAVTAVRGVEATNVSARAYAIRVFVPGESAAGTEGVSAPGDSVAFGGSFSYGEGGTTLASGPLTASALTSRSTGGGRAQASSEVTAVSIFGGEITVGRVSARARATAGTRTAQGDVAGSAVTDLVVLGEPVTAGRDLRVPLADWGMVAALQQQAARTNDARGHRARAATTGLEVTLSSEHAGLPAGTRILVGFAEAEAQTAAEPPTPTRPSGGAGKQPAPPSAPLAATIPREKRPARSKGAATTGRGKARAPRRGAAPLPPEPQRSPLGIPPITRPPQLTTPTLGGGPYVFPVYGLSSYSDTFGAPRANVSWHHGADLFAPLGAPVLAVAAGTVFSVGWNDLGGNRFWLSDRRGNQFYYAHLSAFAARTVNGARVRAGDVLGFVGDTGDAVGTPYHLHFEIHPAGLLGLGYDGAVNPTGYLALWPRRQAIDLPDEVAAAGVAAPATSSSAPRPGAILLHASDISSTSGLEPGSLQEAIVDRAVSEGDGSLVARSGSPGRAGAGRAR